MKLTTQTILKLFSKSEFLAPKQSRHLNKAGEVYQSYLEQNGSRPHKKGSLFSV